MLQCSEHSGTEENRSILVFHANINELQILQRFARLTIDKLEFETYKNSMFVIVIVIP